VESAAVFKSLQPKVPHYSTSNILKEEWQISGLFLQKYGNAAAFPQT
jgi:hypothetical protein